MYAIVLELDRGSCYTYDGSYSNYIQGKEERLANEDQQVHVAKQKYKKECEFVYRVSKLLRIGLSY